MYCISQIFVIGYRILVREYRVWEPDRRSIRHGDDFDWLGGHSANNEAQEVVGLMDALHPLPLSAKLNTVNI